MWAVPNTVNAAARADREERQRDAAELRVKRAEDLGLTCPRSHVASGVPLTLLWQEQLYKDIALVETCQAIDAAREEPDGQDEDQPGKRP